MRTNVVLNDDLVVSITDKDISEVRREMWSRFSEDKV